MSPDPTPAPMSPSQALDAAANDADSNAGQGNVGDPVSSCETAPTPAPAPTPVPTPTPTPTPTPAPKSDLWIRLDLTQAEAANESGSLRLHGGGFDLTLTIAGNFMSNGDTVDVRFTNVPTAANFSLTYIGTEGQEAVLVDSAPFHSLQDNSLPAKDNSAPATTPEEETS